MLFRSTWHGRLHDLSFVLLGLTLMPAMLLLGFAFRQDKHWRSHSPYTWATMALAELLLVAVVRALASVPVVMFEALVVSVVAEFAKVNQDGEAVPLDFKTWPLVPVAICAVMPGADW